MRRNKAKENPSASSWAGRLSHEGQRISTTEAGGHWVRPTKEDKTMIHRLKETYNSLKVATRCLRCPTFWKILFAIDQQPPRKKEVRRD